MRTPALSVSVLLAAASLGLAACGGVDKSAYVSSVTQVQQKTQQEASKLSTEMNKATTPEAVGASLKELGVKIQANARSLEAIKPPDEVKGDHTRYVALMKRFGGQLVDLSAEVSTATSKNVGDVLEKASKYTADLSSTETQLVNDINSRLQS